MAESLETRFQNLHEFVTQARTNLDRNKWDYLIGGSETETTLAPQPLGARRDRLPPADIARCLEYRLQQHVVRQEACASRCCARRSAHCRCLSRAGCHR